MLLFPWFFLPKVLQLRIYILNNGICSVAFIIAQMFKKHKISVIAPRNPPTKRLRLHILCTILKIIPQKILVSVYRRYL